MRVMPFLKTFMAIFVCVACCRAAFGAGPLRLSDIVVEFQYFDFGFDEVKDFLNTFDDIGNASLYRWDYSSGDGLVAFFRNVGKMLSSIGTAIVNVIVAAVRAFVFGTRDVFRLLVKVLKICANIIGVSF